MNGGNCYPGDLCFGCILRKQMLEEMVANPACGFSQERLEQLLINGQITMFAAVHKATCPNSKIISNIQGFELTDYLKTIVKNTKCVNEGKINQTEWSNRVLGNLDNQAGGGQDEFTFNCK